MAATAPVPRAIGWARDVRGGRLGHSGAHRSCHARPGANFFGVLLGQAIDTVTNPVVWIPFVFVYMVERRGEFSETQMRIATTLAVATAVVCAAIKVV